MKYKVPQFIEVEDKLFGPLTAKQGIYLAGGVGVLAVLYAMLPMMLALLIGLPFAGLGAALAFYKRDGTPFAKLIEYGFYYYIRNKLYIWKHHSKKIDPKSAAAKAAAGIPEMYVPKLTESKLKDLAWSLDIKEHLNK